VPHPAAAVVAGRRVAAVAALVLSLALPLAAQTPGARTPAAGPAPASEVQSDTDPTQIVALSARSEYTGLRGDLWQQVFILRSDKLVIRPGRFKWAGKIGVVTRFDVPVVLAGAGDTTHGGLGDLYFQGLYAPHLTRRFALAAGTGFVFPTATDRLTGAGKWRIAPLAVPVFFFPQRRGYALVKTQAHFSFAGASDRPDVRYLLVTPTALVRPVPRVWLLTETEMKQRFVRPDTRAFKTAFEAGRMMRRGMTMAIRPEFGWGENREVDWALKGIVTWYGVKGPQS
jgi:hypothetical protein